MVLKGIKNQFPIPDYIVIIPKKTTFPFPLLQGSYLEKSVANLYSKPLLNCLRRRGNRIFLNKSHFKLIEDKDLLIVSDEILPSPSLYLIGKALLEGCPRSVNLLSVAAEELSYQ